MWTNTHQIEINVNEYIFEWIYFAMSNHVHNIVAVLTKQVEALAIQVNQIHKQQIEQQQIVPVREINCKFNENMIENYQIKECDDDY